MLRLRCLNQSPMHHLLTLLWICWKSRRHSQTSQTKKLTPSRKLLTVQMTNPNPGSIWLWKASHTNKSLFPWTMNLVKDSLKTLCPTSLTLIVLSRCHIQVHLSGNNVPTVKPPLDSTSLPSTVTTLLTTYLMAVLQPSRYSIFHSRDTPIPLSLPWWSYSCQCLNTETSTQGNRGFTTEILSISYTITLYKRLVVTL